MTIEGEKKGEKGGEGRKKVDRAPGTSMDTRPMKKRGGKKRKQYMEGWRLEKGQGSQGSVWREPLEGKKSAGPTHRFFFRKKGKKKKKKREAAGININKVNYLLTGERKKGGRGGGGRGPREEQF